jgi:hypothetical protein
LVEIPATTHGQENSGDINDLNVSIGGYSSTWDTTSYGLQNRQLDLFLTTSSGGVAGVSVSLRYDAEGNDVLDAKAVRGYNFDKEDCVPQNSCNRDEVNEGNPLSHISNGAVPEIIDSGIGAGFIYSIAALSNGGGPFTSKSTEFFTFRVGSVVFEHNDTGQTTVVEPGFFNLGVDGFSDNNFKNAPTTFVSATVVPEASAAALLVAAISFIGIRRRRAARR